ncbi:redox-sensing transcriptional repressor Rex [Jatrophihabitans telluris]|uniref:Redox-sensing transcriptional repressor Rex n=1 Tax=Jatrophihabitans telluris TaxID=2038343 RepID=A0ABY4QYW9_9ACTN|nr:redox-sensing transcriptional repressor Rex [Jatrophihabitans telluris]UQX88871.1 redox-sensing transcriptional repressor Rex [Jatrophihabitans telluris]
MTAHRDRLDAVSVSSENAAAESVTNTVHAERTIPEATVARLALYLRALTGLAEHGTATVSSESLATAAGVNSAKLRKDLSYLGSYGVRGVGYDVALLTEQMRSTLGLNENRAVALIGLGHLGKALAGYTGFATRGFRISALIDTDPELVGTTLREIAVQHVDLLEQIVRSENIAIAVIAVPSSVAQEVCDRLVAAGVTSILNFAPTVLAVPDHVDVRKVDLAAELQILSFHDNRKSARSDAQAGPLSAALGTRPGGGTGLASSTMGATGLGSKAMSDTAIGSTA